MGWFLWGIAIGWAACAIYWYSQVSSDGKKPASGAVVIFLLLGICAVVVSISLGAASGAIPAGVPTPTVLGR